MNFTPGFDPPRLTTLQDAYREAILSCVSDRIPNALEELPAIVPGPQYRFELMATFVERGGGCEAIQICICSQTSAVPTLSAMINMPYCDPIDE